MNDRVLIITRHYMDDNNGGSNASKGFIYSFSALFKNCSLIYAEHDYKDSRCFIPPAVVAFPCYDHRTKIQKALDIYRGRLHRFTDFVKKHLEKNSYNIIVIEHSLTAASTIKFIKSSGAKVITIHENVEADYVKDNEPNILYRYPYDYFVKKAERDSLLLSDINLALTDKDSQIFKSWFPGKDLHLHNIGICEYRKIENSKLRNNAFNEYFVITGSLNFKQSIKPIVDFINSYYPILLNEYPNSKLIIAGRNPNTELVRLCELHPAITLISNPEDIAAVVQKASVYICPINAGSGIKLRVLDGLRQGLPVLCHEVSARGYDNLLKTDFFSSYKDSDSFRAGLVNLCSKSYDVNKIFCTYKSIFALSAGIVRLKTILKEEGI